MSKLSFELTRTDVRVKGNYFLLIQLDETEFPSKLTKTQKFRTEIDYSTQFPSFQQNYYSFNKVNLGNKLILRIGLFKVNNPDKLKRKVKIEEKKKVEDINNKQKKIKNDINPKILFSESELIGNVEISLDSVWIENLRKCKFVESDSKLLHPEKREEENGKVKEYYKGKLTFEGEYLNGKRNGKGKEYYYNGELIFEGEYLNGKKMEKEKNIIIVIKLHMKEIF